MRDDDPDGDQDAAPDVDAWIRQAGQADPAARREAVSALGDIAREHRGAIPEAIPVLLLAMADPDPTLGDNALWALAYCAPESIAALCEHLNHLDATVRERAAHALGNIGPEACEAAATPLRQRLSDAQGLVRQRAAWALGLLHDVHADTVRDLLALIVDGDLKDAGAALHALGNLGRAAGPALLAPHHALLLSALDSPGERTRQAALYAASTAGLDPAMWADRLLAVVARDPSSEVRAAALHALKVVTPGVLLPAAVSQLLPGLAAPGREASLTCEVLALMRPKAADAVPALKSALATNDLVIAAATALWRIEGRAETIVPALRRVFADWPESVCDLVCELGAAAAELLPDILAALAEDNWDLQWAAVDALRAIGADDPDAQAALLGALTHPSPIVRSGAARALAASGPRVLPALTRCLADTTDPRGAWAAYALGEMGPTAAPALSALRAVMGSQSQPLAGCAAIALVRIASEVGALPVLLATLDSEDPSAPRRAAAQALGDLGPAAAAAVNALTACAAADADSAVAEAARESLRAIQGAPH